MRILVTGADGQLGHALRQNSIVKKHDVLWTGRRADSMALTVQLDITDASAVLHMISDYKAELIINCAAYTAVDRCEIEEDIAYRINALGPANLADAAESIGAALVQISTDYVFDGMKTVPYTAEDEPCPENAYGRTKYSGERYVKEKCSRAYIIRTAWLYGDGRNFVQTMLRLADKGETIHVVDDQFGNPTSAAELARIVMAVAESGRYGIYHGVCEGMASWYEFAAAIMEEAGVQAELIPIPSSQYRTAAKRPTYSVLDTESLISIGYNPMNWRLALKKYFSKI